jgi:monovalent cation:proton antiporter-2 (CPA2) family protein
MAASETAAAHAPDLVSAVILLGAAVVSVPLFKRAGLGAVLGYLAAGLLIGPYGLRVFAEPAAILHVAELGVVMFLFVIGLEMKPSRLKAMSGDIFGLGLTQLLVCMALLSVVGVALGYGFATSLIAGTGFVLTSTAIVMQMLEERRDIGNPKGQRVLSILLLEDLAIVPLLALVTFLAPGGEAVSLAERGKAAGIGLGAIVALILIGRFLLNPVFRVLAAAKAREVMTAAALLVVLGAALVMQVSGLSAAMGAFLAGVLLSESRFRHQLEVDVEPFRGLLLGLFFIAVGMSLDLKVVWENAGLVALTVVAFTALKALGIYGVARAFRASHREALERTVLMAQGGEFAFVLYGAALGVGLINPTGSAVLSAVIILSMVMTPVFIALHDAVMKRAPADTAGTEGPDGAPDRVLLIGFGRFGQIVSQALLARGHAISIIDNDGEVIRTAEQFGFKVFYGDGTRLDLLEAAGVREARAVIICADGAETAARIVELVKAECPTKPILARAYDRASALALVREGVDMTVRETLESAFVLGRMALETLGDTREEADAMIADVRARDAERFSLQLTEGIYAGRDLLVGNMTAEKAR